MAIVGISLDETREYISKHDPDRGKPTIFVIGLLDPFVRSYVDDQMTQFGISPGGPDKPAQTSINISGRNLEIVRFGLRDIKNLIDPVTKEAVRFISDTIPVKGKSYKAVSDQILRLIPPIVIKELAREIGNDNLLMEDEVKNLP